MSEIDQQPEDFFEVEITDLAPPARAESVVFARVSCWLLRWQRPERRRARRWLGGALLVALVGMLLSMLFYPSAGVTALLAAHWPSTLAPPSASGALVGQAFFHPANEIFCPVQSSWSPNSSLIAVLGYTQPCNQNAYVPAEVNLYRASTTQQVAHWQPDAAIFTAIQHSPTLSPHIRAELVRKPIFGQARGYGAVPAIQYLQMLWSPDAARIALSFGVITRAMIYEGLFLARVDGSHPAVLLQPEPFQTDPQHFAPLLWDVQSGRSAPLPALPLALTYSWGPQGRLTPGPPLTAQNNASYASIPIGNPDGDRSFSIWQPGHRIVLSLVHTPGVYLWDTSFAAWSPDERYIITNLVFMDLMEPAGQTFPAQEALHTLRVDKLPRVPAHDPTLLSASSDARIVAWDPAGSILAVYTLAGTVDLYDCYTGHLLRSLKPLFAHPLSGDATLLSWSPNGSSLLLTSAQGGLITVWGPGTLGRLWHHLR